MSEPNMNDIKVGDLAVFIQRLWPKQGEFRE